MLQVMWLVLTNQLVILEVFNFGQPRPIFVYFRPFLNTIAIIVQK